MILPKLFRKKISVWGRLVRIKAKNLTFKGLGGAPIYFVVKFFVKGMIEGSVSTRASAVAFSFFVAIFPTIIFVFTLIPYVPIQNFQEQLLALIEGVIPKNAFLLVEATLVDVVTRKSGGLLSFGFIAALFFSHNGIIALIDAFNATYHTIESRSFIKKHLAAFLLTIILPLLVTISVALMLFGQLTLSFLVGKDLLELNITYYLIFVGKWLITLMLFFFCISFLYYFAPSKRSEFKFFSSGATMATIMIIVTSLVFSYLVNNTLQYNKLYGSIGSLLALMAWIYFNSIGLIVGFDLNVSISIAKRNYWTKKAPHDPAEELSTD